MIVPLTLLALALSEATPPAESPPATPVRTPPQPGDPDWPDQPEVQIHHLSGGAEVRIWERHELPLVRVELSVTWPGNDADLETRLAAGLASSLLESGTRQRSGTELAEAMDLLGADWDLGMNYTRAWADIEAPTGQEIAALALAAEALRGSAYTRREARRITKRWADWRDALASDLYRVHERAVNHAWFPADHPARHRADGDAIRAVRAGDARAVVEGAVETGQALIVVVGDTTPEQILPALEAHYGDLTGRTLHTTIPAAAPEGGIWLVDQPGLDVAEITLLAPGPSITDPAAGDGQILMGLFAGNFTSRLGQDLRETRGLTYGVSGQLDSWRETGRLRIDVEVESDRAVEALGAMSGQLDQLLVSGVSQAEVDQARNTLRVDSATPSLAGGAALLGNLWMDGLELDDLAAGRAAVDAATPDSVHAAARKWLAPEQQIWVITGDAGVLGPRMRAAGWHPSREVSAKKLSAER